MMNVPRLKPILLTKASREKADVLFKSPAFSDINAPEDAVNADSETPSITAPNISMLASVVRAKTAIVKLARTFPKIRNFFLPYLSAKIPRGILVTRSRQESLRF